MLTSIKRLFTPYPHRRWITAKRLIAVLLAASFLTWLLGQHRWPRAPKDWKDTTVDA